MMVSDSTWICLMCSHPHDVGAHPLGDRDGALCSGCGASTRARAMAQAFLATMAPLSVVRRADRPRVAGVSDNPVFGRWMAGFTDYVNFQFGEEPHLDLTEVPRSLEGSFEIVTCGDVLEHVAPPVSRAFEGISQLLVPGGCAILSVPAGPEGGIEHFPHLHDWHVDGVGDERILINRRADGSVEQFDDLVWHGGEGWTLEMRVFDRAWFHRELLAAGFVDVIELRRNWPHLGISFEDWSRVWIARKPESLVNDVEAAP